VEVDSGICLAHYNCTSVWWEDATLGCRLGLRALGFICKLQSARYASARAPHSSGRVRVLSAEC
jgi:hypothetical protein